MRPRHNGPRASSGIEIESAPRMGVGSIYHPYRQRSTMHTITATRFDTDCIEHLTIKNLEIAKSISKSLIEDGMDLVSIQDELWNEVFVLSSKDYIPFRVEKK